jgi:CBS domain-containing protein
MALPDVAISTFNSSDPHVINYVNNYGIICHITPMIKKIGSWMKHRVVSIGPQASLMDAAQLMYKKNVGTLPVVDEKGHLLGITNMRKVVRFFLPDFVNVVEDVDFVHDFGAINIPSPLDIKKSHQIKMADYMDEAVSVDEDASLMRGLALMITHDLQDLPVVSNDKLVGIVSRVDIGRAFLHTWLESPKKKSSTKH